VEAFVAFVRAVTTLPATIAQILMSAKLGLSAKTMNSASIHTVLTGALLK